MSLNKEQNRAVKIVDGRVLVLAGAGSGKTKVLTHRISHLIKNNGIKPHSILALTFTNKAALEMQERLKKLIGVKNAKEVMLTTFHSFCVKLLRQEADKIGYSKNFSIYDDKDIRRLLNQQSKDILKKQIDISTESLIESISSLKNKNLSLDEMPSLGSPEKDKFFKDLYKNVNSSLKTYNAIDFDSLLTLSVELFKKDKKVLEKYQTRFKYILIDEFQDTNPIQYKLAEQLSRKHNNLFVVGDDDQSIYGWRGSCIEHILHFKADHKIKLEQNYRSTQSILNAANSVIKNNKQRHDKTLFSNISSDEKIILFHAPTEVEEASSVINRLISLKNKRNLKWSDIAILYRSNALSRNFEASLINANYKKNDSWFRGIPYKVYGGLSFADRAEIKDILSYLKFLSNFKDEEALLRIINVPRRGISDNTIDIIKKHSKQKKCSFFSILEKINTSKIDSIDLNPRAIKALKLFYEIIMKAKKRFSKKPLHKALKWFIEEINYKKAIEEEVKSEKARIVKWENAQECINALAQYEEEEKNPTLYDFISTTQLNKENFRKNKNSTKDAVQLMTIHSSKGLEFEACFIVGLEDHILPHEKSVMDTSIEEERRLFYVAITRAKRHLTLSMTKARKNRGKPKATIPSRFLFEVPKNLLKISTWKSFE